MSTSALPVVVCTQTGLPQVAYTSPGEAESPPDLVEYFAEAETGHTHQRDAQVSLQ